MKPNFKGSLVGISVKALAIGTIASLSLIAYNSQKVQLLSAVQAVAPTQQAKDAVTEWNAIALSTIRTDKTSPPMAAHNLAMVHGAVYDAVNAIAKTHKPYRVEVQAPPGASESAATIAAAHRMLVNLYPKQAAALDAAKTESLAKIAEGKSKTDGIKLGETVAEQAAEEAGISRIYGGAHWMSDNRDGLTAGRNLGKYVVQNFLTQN